MKKLVFLLLATIFTLSLSAQTDQKYKRIKGKINVSLQEDASQINVFNLENGQYTYTNEYGEFQIDVKEGDELVFTAVQYQQFSVIISAATVSKGKLNINLNMKATQLEEVIVKSGLSGDIQVDIKKIDTQKANLSVVDVQEAIYGSDYEFSADQYTTPKNGAIDKGYLENGINFVNIFKAVFGLKNQAQEKENVNLDEQIRQLYSTDFFKKYMNVEEEEVNDFIFFMEERGLSISSIRRMNDLELIDYVLKESEEYQK